MSNVFPKKILIGLQEGDCNLSCPKCYTHGETKVSEKSRGSGVMDFDNFVNLIKEIAPYKPRVTPQTWDEPLLTPNIYKYLKVMKDHGLTVTMDTNGILLNEKAIGELVSLEIDSVFISLDATTPDVFEKVRGKNTFELIKKNILNFLNKRGDNLYPRIGVSFVVEDENEHQEEDFVSYWSPLVDVVRVNRKFDENRMVLSAPKGERTPCWSLYDSLMVRHDGRVSLCCVDTHTEVDVGNVFDSGLYTLWNNGKFKEVRSLHEAGEYSKISICEDCNLWSNEKAQVRDEDEYLISKTNTHYYVNKKSRLKSAPSTNRYLSQEKV